MIKIITTTDKITVIGHASNSVETLTKDEVECCAAVTASIQTVLFGLNELTDNAVPYELEKGYFSIEKSYLDADGSLLIGSLEIALQAISEVYPEQVTFKEL